MIKDVRGKVVQVGDEVAFAGGGKGASEFYVGKVIKLTPKGVTIQTSVEYTAWDSKVNSWVGTGSFFDREFQRNQGMFAILEKL